MNTLPTVFETIILPALVQLPEPMDTTSARAMLIAIGLQESRFLHRRQLNGPARGFWQFERGGGVHGVLVHPNSRGLAARIATDHNVAPVTTQAVYDRLEFDDLLACKMARLLLWTDAAPLPPSTPENAETAWQYYLRVWRPGKPHRQTWDAFWARAVEAVS